MDEFASADRHPALAADANAFLVEAGAVLASSLDYGVTLDQIARLAVPHLADWCAVYVAEEDQIRCAGLAHIEPDKCELLKGHLSRHDPAARESSPVRLAMRTGKPQWGNDLCAESWTVELADSEPFHFLRDVMGVRGWMVVPMLSKERAVGALCIQMPDSGQHQGPVLLEKALGLARIAALAVDNAALHRATQRGMRGREMVLSVAAHELRSSLHVLLMGIQCTQMLCEQGSQLVTSPSWLTELLQKFERQGLRMSQLLDQLFDVSQINAGLFELRRESCDLGVIVRDTAAQFDAALAQAGCALKVRVDPSVTGNWDRLRIEQVIINLLTNAIKYGAGQPIDMEVTADQETAWLRVTDHGIGIAPADQKHVFDAFWRASSVAGHHNLGLGLSIVRAIVEAHGGTIHLVSEPGAGSTFLIELSRRLVT